MLIHFYLRSRVRWVVRCEKTLNEVHFNIEVRNVKLGTRVYHVGSTFTDTMLAGEAIPALGLFCILLYHITVLCWVNIVLTLEFVSIYVTSLQSFNVIIYSVNFRLCILVMYISRFRNMLYTSL